MDGYKDKGVHVFPAAIVTGGHTEGWVVRVGSSTSDTSAHDTLRNAIVAGWQLACGLDADLYIHRGEDEGEAGQEPLSA